MDVQLFRIDDRLIHGQVVIGWVKYLKSKRIILCDDDVVKNEWEKELYGEVDITSQLLLSDEEKSEDIEKKFEDLSEIESDLDSKTVQKDSKPLFSDNKSKEYEDRMKEEDELMKMIKTEIPDISEMEATILQDQLLEVDKEDRKSRIEMYRLTKELEK